MVSLDKVFFEDLQKLQRVIDISQYIALHLKMVMDFALKYQQGFFILKSHVDWEW